MSPFAQFARAHARWLGATLSRRWLTTVLLAWLGANSTTAGMVFLVLVVWSATQAGICRFALCARSLRGLLRLFLSAAVRTFRLAGCRSGWR